MGVNPLRYLVAPRFLAGIFVMPLLTVFSCLMGILGGYLISVYLYGMSPIQFFDPMIQHVSHFDFISGMCKAFIFGILIVTICCFMGLRTHGGAEGVGRYTTSSVVACYTFILFANFIATLTLNTLHTTWKAM